MVTEQQTEQRESFGERMKRIRAEKTAGRNTGAVVDRKPLVRTVSNDEAFIMANTGVKETSQVYSEEDMVTQGPATIFHQSPGRVQLWKPQADGSFSPRDVSSSSIPMLLKHGWKIACPDCGTNHEQSIYPAKDYNSCPARESVAWTRCPVATCGKRLFDHLSRRTTDYSRDANSPDGDAMIAIEGTDMSTSEMRLKHEFLMHMWHRHPREAEMRNLPRLVQDLMPVQPR